MVGAAGQAQVGGHRRHSRPAIQAGNPGERVAAVGRLTIGVIRSHLVHKTRQRASWRTVVGISSNPSVRCGHSARYERGRGKASLEGGLYGWNLSRWHGALRCRRADHRPAGKRRRPMAALRPGTDRAIAGIRASGSWLQTRAARAVAARGCAASRWFTTIAPPPRCRPTSATAVACRSPPACAPAGILPRASIAHSTMATLGRASEPEGAHGG